MDTFTFSPSVLKWARVKRFGSTHVALESNISKSSKGVEIEDILAWESGKVAPSFEDVKKLADLYKRPLAVFFLSEPPHENENPPDLRSLGSGSNRELSAKALLAIRRARHVQDTYAALSSELGENNKFKYKKFDIAVDSDVVAERVRSDFKVDLDLIKGFSTYEDYFEYLRSHIEAAGVITIKSALQDSVPIKDFRALSLTDSAPFLILINNQDYEGAKNFSLMHEFAHILVRKSGICNNFINFDYSGRDHKRTEAFCNKFAASFLVPMSEFLGHGKIRDGFEISELNSITKKLALDFKVSKVVILRRLLSAHLIAKSLYDSKIKEWDSSVYPPRKHGGQFSISSLVRKNGQKFSSLLFEAFKQKKIPYSGIAENLGFNRKYISKVSEILRSHAG